ncbi:hypothetical protein ACA910_017513 [Epithemia clementina (nom. ined.)]
MDIVTKLGPFDVLFGRGSGPNDHEGNIRFRKLVAERKEEYMATNHRMTKAKIAREIVDAVLRENGRFLKKIEPEEAKVVGLPEGLDAWTSVDDDTIMEKAKQALRQNTNKNKGQPDPIQKYAVPAVGSTSIRHLPSKPLSLGSPMTDLGYVIDDLEPIPIPSAQFPGQTDIPSPTPVKELYPEVDPVRGLRTDCDARLPSPQISGTDQEESISHKSIPVASLSAQQQQQRMPYPNIPTSSSQQNEMRPPALRAPSSRRSSTNSYTLRWDKGLEKSMEISDLMDSFSKTHLSSSATRDEHRNMGNSVESMGTIEPMSFGSEANMSYVTMNSSVFSVLRPDDGGVHDEKGGPKELKDFPTPDNERSFRELEQEEAPSYVRVFPSDRAAGLGMESDFMSSTKMGLASDASMSIADLGVARRRQASSVVLKDVKEQGYRDVFDAILGEVGHPVMHSEPGAGIEAMGSSSLNLLKGMLLSQEEMASVTGGGFQQGQDDSQVRSKNTNDSN